MTIRRFAAIAALAGLALAVPAFADNPGHGKGNKGHGSSRESGGVSLSVEISDSQRAIILGYYGGEIARGHCPPGLAKKHNGCMPPGQAKKWARGRPLPRDVVFYDLPPALAVRLTAPAGARYVRVAADILLIAAGTGMVLDAVEDLTRQ